MSRRAVPALASLLPLLALCAAVSLQKIRSLDYWWHLRTGQLIAETGAVPTADPFTYTVAGEPWLDSHWLYQLGLYGVYAAGGHAGVVLSKLALVVLLTGLLATIGYRSARPGVTTAALALMLLGVFERVIPRPELLSFVLLAAVLALLERNRHRRDAWLYLLLPVQLVWVNVHGLWVLGPLVCGAYLASELLEALRRRESPLGTVAVRRLLAGLALMAACAFVNPNGIEGAIYPLHFVGMIQTAGERDALGASILELDPLIGGLYPLDASKLGFFFATAGLCLTALLLNRRRAPWSDVFVGLAFFLLALSANRNRALFAVATAPLLIRNCNEWLDARPLRSSAGARRAARIAVPLLTLVAAADIVRGGPLAALRDHAEPGLGVLERIHPVAAVDWIAREHPAGPLAHHQADGGYLIWRLYPEYPVLIDGRLEIYGAERLIDLSYMAPPGFQRLDARYDFGTVLVHHAWVPSDELLWWLRRSPKWRLAFADDAAAVFVRRRSGNPADEPDLALGAPGLFPPFEGPLGFSDFERRRARGNFFYALHRYERARRVWEETAALYPDHPDVPFQQARMLYATGDIAAGDVVLDRVLQERPRDARLHLGAGSLRLAAGRSREAKQLYDAALALDPDLVPALFARARLAADESDRVTQRALYRRLLDLLPPSDPAHSDVARRLAALDAPAAQRP